MTMLAAVPQRESLLSHTICQGTQKYTHLIKIHHFSFMLCFFDYHTTSFKSDLDCSQFGNDYDVLDQFPFHIIMNPTDCVMDMSFAHTNDDRTYITCLDIRNVNNVP